MSVGNWASVFLPFSCLALTSLRDMLLTSLFASLLGSLSTEKSVVSTYFSSIGLKIVPLCCGGFFPYSKRSIRFRTFLSFGRFKAVEAMVIGSVS